MSPISPIKQKGAASLLTILAVASLTLVIGITLSSGGFIESAATGGQVKTDETFAAAQAGLDDALMRLARNKNFASGGYGLSVGSASVIITVEQTPPSSCSGGIGLNQACVISIAALDNKTRRLEMILNVDSGGRLTQQSWKEN